MSENWALPLPMVLAPGAETTLSTILAADFGPAATNMSQAWLEYYGADWLQTNDFNYWNPASPSHATWYVNGTAIQGATSTHVLKASFSSDTFQAGNDIGDFAYIFAGSAWYSMITIAPNLVSLPANNHEPTAADVVAAAYRFNSYYGFVANDNDCHMIAMELAASVGATLTVDSGSLDPTQNVDGGFWRVVYRGSQANPVSNWQTLVQPGDIVRMGWTGGGQHTTTVLAVNPDGSIVVYDNAYYPGSTEGIGIHTVNYDTQTIAADITIYRLSTDNLYLQDATASGETILGTLFNDKIVGLGGDTLTGGLGNDVFQESGGTNSIDGGGGRNVVDYTVASTQATITHNSNGSWKVVAGAETDTLNNIQVLQFTDKSIALRDGPHFDVVGDGTSDVLLYSGNSLIDWTVNNGVYSGYNPIGGIAGYQVAGTGDFNGDGTSDILLKNGAGGLIDWIMNNGVYSSYTSIGNTSGYNVVGTGDFNADGTTDVLLQNAGGSVIDWILTNGGYWGYNYVGGAGAYGVVGTGNFNGDGTTGVLLENGGGNLIDWTIHNGVYAGWNQIGNAASSGYGVVGTGDFSGNGTTDILLENGGGNVIDWMMKNGAFVGWNEIGGAGGYGVVGTGDYNGDGTTDILLENSSQNIIDWTIQNGTFSGWNGIANTSGYLASKT